MLTLLVKLVLGKPL